MTSAVINITLRGSNKSSLITSSIYVYKWLNTYVIVTPCLHVSSSQVGVRFHHLRIPHKETLSRCPLMQLALCLLSMISLGKSDKEEDLTYQVAYADDLSGGGKTLNLRS